METLAVTNPPVLGYPTDDDDVVGSGGLFNRTFVPEAVVRLQHRDFIQGAPCRSSAMQSVVPHENELIGIAVVPAELKVAPLECRKLAAS